MSILQKQYVSTSYYHSISENPDSSEVDQRAPPSDLAEDIKIPHFKALIHTFLWHQLGFQPAKPLDLNSNIIVYTSALAIYHALSDTCGTHSMTREHIHVTPRWGKSRVPCYDTAFAVTNPNILGMGGLDIARVKLLFSFKHCGETYPCALIHWFSKIGEEPDRSEERRVGKEC